MVDIAHDKHVGESGDPHLQRGGDADIADAPEHTRGDFHLVQAQAVRLLAAQEQQHHQHRGDKLGQDGGNGSAGDAQAQHRHKQQVKPGVHQGGEDEEIQGTGGIPHRPEDAGTDVIQ